MRIDANVTVSPESPVGRLRLSTDDAWTRAVEHRFVDELFDGTIDEGVMRDYLIQDYQFFDPLLSMLGGCVAHADTIDAKLVFARQLGFLAADEDGYFIESFRTLGVAPEEYAAPSSPALRPGSRPSCTTPWAPPTTGTCSSCW